MKLALACALLIACSGGESASGGRFSFGWQLTENGQSIDCAAAGAESIRIVTDNGVATGEEFLCTDGEATTAVREPGDYAIVVSALDGGGAVITSSSDQDTILDGQITELDVFPLEIAEQLCDSASCPTGCCDNTGTCVDPQTDAACGISGVSCVDCTGLGQVCNTTEGMCID